MANEVQLPYFRSRTLYFLIRRVSDGQVWNTALQAFQVYSAANYANYDIAMTESGGAGTSGYYMGSIPNGVGGVNVSEDLDITIKEQTGGSPSENPLIDPDVGFGAIPWSWDADADLGRVLAQGQLANDVLHGGDNAQLELGSATSGRPALWAHYNGDGVNEHAVFFERAGSASASQAGTAFRISSDLGKGIFASAGELAVQEQIPVAFLMVANDNLTGGYGVHIRTNADGTGLFVSQGGMVVSNEITASSYMGGNFTGSVGSVASAVTVGTINSGVITRQSLNLDSGMRPIVSNTFPAGACTSTTLTTTFSTAAGNNGVFVGCKLRIYVNAVVAEQEVMVTSHTTGSNIVFTFEPPLVGLLTGAGQYVLLADRNNANLASLDQSALDAIANDVWDLVDGIELNITPRLAMRAIASALAGDVESAGAVYRALANAATTRLTVVDTGQNRTVTPTLL